MRRSEQIEDLLNAIRNVDESKLQEVEKGKYTGNFRQEMETFVKQ